MSGYDRPHDRWRCGLESHGDPCAPGPTCAGRCPAAAECAPVRDGDRWVCNRSALRGGPCGEGPSPEGACRCVKACRPTRSLRAIRARWLTGTAAASAGLVLMLLGAQGRNELAAPGALTSHHAQVIARGDWAHRCASCHPGANGSAADWLAAAWDAGHGVTQSSLCLDCHQGLAAEGAEPLLAHGLPAGALGNRQAKVSAASFAGFSPAGEPALGASAEDPVACAACHVEHHGTDHDLTAITDARCQACHAERYGSFATDHPDFGLWPTTRRTRIAFHHASHAGEHFAKAGKPFDCRACHLEDATGDLTARPSYQAACAECHEADLLRSFGDGIDVLALPTLDLEAIAAAGGSVQAWPAAAEGDFDGELTPFTKLLLAADTDALAALRRLGEDFSFFDVEDDASAADAAVLAGAITRLLDDLQEEGHGAIALRLRKLLGDRAGAEADYVARLPVELIDRVQSTWLGGAAPPEEFGAVEDRRTGGGWSIDDLRVALRYRPTGHDDPFLRAWLEAILALPPEHTGLRDACLAEFTRPGAPGGCLDCHSVERSGADGLTINWRGRDRLAEPRGFTRFSHRPHLVQPELADCTHCHASDPAAKEIPYTGYEATRFAAEFAQLGKSACVACHKPHAAGDTCTQCHRYHVDPPR